MHKLFPLLFALLLIGCVAIRPATVAPVTAQEVADQFDALGLVSDIRPGERREGSPLPNSYSEHIQFTIAEVAPRGGQIFVCDTKRNCDAMYAYFDALVALAGPYLYQSPSGLVVVQLNSGLTPDHAAKFEAIVQGLP